MRANCKSIDLAKQEKRGADELDLLKKLAVIDPHNRPVWRALIQKLVEAKSWEEARAFGESAMFVDVENAGTHVAYAQALAPYKLKWFEEPTDPLGYEVLTEFIAQYSAAVGTGENLFSTQDVENLVTFGGMRAGVDFIQTDVPQSYGIVQFSRTLEMLKRRGWSRQSVFPHGGNQMTLHLVGGFGLGGCEAYPGVFGIFAGFADDANVENGYLKLPDRPGIGFEAQNQLYSAMRALVS